MTENLGIDHMSNSGPKTYIFMRPKSKKNFKNDILGILN